MQLALRQTRSRVRTIAVLLALVTIVTSPGESRGATAAAGIAGRQTFAALAFNATNYLVVWMDERPGAAGSDIYGARISPGGAVLDPGGIAISTAAGDQQKPALAFDGTNFLVVWMDDRSGTGSGFDIFGGRVSPDGTVLDPDGIAISFARSGCGPCIVRPALAFDGSNYLVVWRKDVAGSSDIYGARVSPAGVVLDAGGIPIATGPGSEDGPAVAFGGTNYLVAWGDFGSGNLYGARVNPAGAVLDPAGIPISARRQPSTFAGARLRRRELPRRVGGLPHALLRRLRRPGEHCRFRARPGRHPDLHRRQSRTRFPDGCLRRHELRRRLERQPL